MSILTPHGIPGQDYGAFTGKTLAATFAASVPLTCTPTATLTTSIQFSASVPLTLTPAPAALTTVTNFGATQTLSMTASGQLYVGARLIALMPHGIPGQAYGSFIGRVVLSEFAATVPLSVTATGTLTTAITLAASTPLTVTGLANTFSASGPWALLLAFLAFDTAPPNLMAGSAGVSLTAAGTLTTAIPFSANLSMTLTPVASLTTSISFASAVPLTLTAAPAPLTTAITLAGASLGSLTATGTLTTATNLAGAAGASLQATGALTTAITLAAARTMTISSTATMITSPPEFMGFSTVSLTGTGNLQTAGTSLNASVPLTLIGSGTLTTTIGLAASVGLTLGASGSLTASIEFAASIPLRLIPVATLQTVINLGAPSTPLTLTGSGSMQVPAQLAASQALTLTAAAATLTTGIELAAQGLLTLSTTATMTTAIAMGGSTLLRLTAQAALDLILGEAILFGVPPRVRIFPFPRGARPAPVVTKRPSESFLIGIDFAKILEDQETLVQGEALAHDQYGVDTAATILVGAIGISPPGLVTQRCAAGTNGQRHTVEFRMLTSFGNTFESELQLCIDAGAHRVGALSKQPHETAPVGVVFARWLNPNETLVDTAPTKSITAYNDATLADSTGEVIGGSGIVVSPNLSVRIIHGLDGERHIAAYRVPTSGNNVFEAEVAISVDET